jgi:hypothetical protein
VQGSPVNRPRATSRRRLGAVAIKLATAVGLTILVLTATSAPASAISASGLPDSLSCPSSNGELPPAPFARGLASDWGHVEQVTGWLRYSPPRRRVVYLLGGSATRESVTSESGWAAQLSRLTGKPTTAFVCATSCQTFVEDALIAKSLPKDRGTVLLSVGTSRFIMLHEPASLPQYSIRRTPPLPWYQHHYAARTSLPYKDKRRLVATWVDVSYPLSQERCQDRLAELAAAIDACQARGLRVALLNMPLNLAVVGHAFDDALATYKKGCQDLADEQGIQYLDFVSSVRLTGTDYFDLQHLLPPGRARWQRRLSLELLRKHLL